MNQSESLIRQAEAARLLGWSRHRIAKAVRRRNLRSQRVTLVSRADVEALCRGHRPAGYRRGPYTTYADRDGEAVPDAS
jgi:hypothetical protein